MKKIGELGIAAATTLVIAIVITAIVAGTVGYVVKPAPPEVTELQARVSELETTVAEQSARISELEEAGTIKAGFIYVGPIADQGWTMAHNRGREIVDNKYDWLETTYAETVPEAEVGSYIDTMFEAGADVVFTTSFGFGWYTVTAGGRWPDKMLYHCSGDPSIMGSAPNVGFYFNDFYQLYYMNGLAAGALTKTNKLGYVAAFTTSELVRHMDAFFLGAKEVNPNVTMKVLVTGAWVDPETDAMNARTLMDWGADVIAFTADAPAVISACQKHYEDTGQKIYTFSHYSPMKSFGPDVVVSGQLVHWEKVYEDLLLKARAGKCENWQHWYELAAGGYVELGSDWNEPINPIFVNDLKVVTVTDPVLGNISVYDLILYRYEQFKSDPVGFEPFKGPITDTAGTLRLKAGEVIKQDNLRWTLDWYPVGIIPPA